MAAGLDSQHVTGVHQGLAAFGAGEAGAQAGPRAAQCAPDEVPRGRHFPAMEAPAQLAADLRAFFGPLE